jgi:hypothetical protein
MRFLFVVSLLALVPLAANAEPIRIGGETKYKPHSLVRLKAEGVDAKAALLWRVYPSKDVQRATSTARPALCPAVEKVKWIQR